MNDDLGLFADTAVDVDETGPSRGSRGGNGKRSSRRRRGRKPRGVLTWLATFVVLALVLAGAWYGARQLLDIGSYADYSGDGTSDVVVQVQSGDTISDVAVRLQQADVVASARAFTKAAQSDDRVKSLQPGYYLMKTKMSGTAAVSKIVDSHSRVGSVEIRAGYQLDDITAPDGSVIKGILSRIADASCATINGQRTCVSAQDLHHVAETASPAALGVPDWAAANVAKAAPQHRLEGLIMPGLYDVKPGASALDVLKSVLATSAVRLQAAGMPSVAADTGFQPYDLLIMASLVQKEAITQDFPKVARVTYNRLAIGMPLGYDSTTNYVLDQPIITTTTQDRARSGPYDTYHNTGLPPTPIGSFSAQALTAAAKPADGKWLFFVKCQKDGTTCFENTVTEHDKDIADAQARGVY